MDVKGRLLIVDDEESMRDMLEISLKRDGHEVDTAENGKVALELFSQHQYDMVIQDLKMPEMDGLELLKKIRGQDARMPVVIMTAFSTWDVAVEAMRIGAYDYLKKPFDMDEVRGLVQRVVERNVMSKKVDQPAQASIPDIRYIGSTQVVQDILNLIQRVATTDSTVVIQGESGTGKELISRMIHLESLRKGGPFISVNCGAFSETLLESEIFGHKRGSFTGAVADKKGLLELADGGTFFLDEVGEMSLHTQVRLLRALETREFIPVGGTDPLRVDVRFVAATNRDLTAMVDQKTFREDLFYRLNVIPVHLPSLRERREDIPLLAGHFLAQYNRLFGRNIIGFDASAEAALMEYDWPGNIRELQNTIQRAVTLTDGEFISAPQIIPARKRKNVLDDSANEPTPEPEIGESVDS
ncbi:MAG: sigma-54-dependent Fis family transcriptional regulator, partial [Planctomycetes bacterium]|nr:sigma-54-dependent Fis family transcriptional regulator [Planctomycetota bacterium]